MDLEKLRQDLIYDEGIMYRIYLDHLGYPTFGIGHLIKESDPEYGMPEGSEVSHERVISAFEEDIQQTILDCTRLYTDFYELPEEAQLVIANMMFNLGRSRFSKFQKMKAAINNRDWISAANEMKNSLWYKQVTNRAERLIARIRSLD